MTIQDRRNIRQLDDDRRTRSDRRAGIDDGYSGPERRGSKERRTILDRRDIH